VKGGEALKVVNGWVDEAIEIDYAQKSMSRSGYKPRYIVVHGTAGGSSAENIANYFATSDVQSSTHFIIGRDGHIVQGLSMDVAAWGNGTITAGHASYLPDNVNPNFYTISIEHVKPSTDNSDVLSSIQEDKSFRLIRCICDAYGIPKRAGDKNGGIIAHADIDPINRSRCPGPYPWERLWTFLKGGKKVLDLNDPVVSRYFTDGGNGTWKCKKNGVVLLGRILIFYRSYGGPALLGLPLAGEDYSQPDAAYVVCERAIIIYDPHRRYDNPPIEGPCYLIHIDGGLGKQILLQRDDNQTQTLTARLKQIHDISQL
jgi:N-acetyl-anhydromuramyl-L-alanine amidase AmpD